MAQPAGSPGQLGLIEANWIPFSIQDDLGDGGPLYKSPGVAVNEIANSSSLVADSAALWEQLPPGSKSGMAKAFEDPSRTAPLGVWSSWRAGLSLPGSWC